MAVCVDELKQTPRSWPWPKSCHLFDDEGNLERLHAFANVIGLKRTWFQNRFGFPHYDISPRKRMIAVAMGAKDVKLREVLKTGGERG